MFCSKCGHNLVGIQDSFCTNCGSAINRNPENPKASPEHPKNDGENARYHIPSASRKTGKKLKATIVAFILILGLGVGGFFLWESIPLATSGPEDELSQEALDSLTENNLYDSITATAQQEAPELSIGDIIDFGGIEWRVLDRQGDKALLISEYILEQKAYHTRWENTSWEDSRIRRYLNSEFLNRFTTEEKNRIVETRVINDNNPWFGTSGGSDTTDYVFLLSLDEVVRYFGDSGQLSNQNHPDNTDWGFFDRYNRNRVAYNLNVSASWWLRSPGIRSNNAAVVLGSGSVSVNGIIVYRNYSGIRPALWLNY